MGRFDTFRILLPGAIVTVLIDLVARILLLTPSPGSHWAEVDRFVGFLESPLPAVVVAFGIGLVLYMLDPAYSSPEYFQDIPSEHLRGRLEERGMDSAHALSLYFLASDGAMPTPLQDRALLYGALFRTGYQLTVYVLLAGAMSPWLVFLHPEIEFPSAWKPAASGFVSVGLVVLAVTVVSLIQLSRTGEVDRRSLSSRINTTRDKTVEQLKTQPEAWVVPTVATVTAVATAASPRALRLEAAVLIPLMLVMLAWLGLRFLGPIEPRLERLRQGTSKKPDSPFRTICRLTLDLAPVLVGAVGMLAISPFAAPSQLGATGGLLVVGYTLSFARKVERQQNGIYRNQNAWLDLHMGELLEQAERLSAASQPARSTEAATGADGGPG